MVMDKVGFKNTGEDRYFEDYVPGSVHEFGRITIEEEGIVSFGKQFDPQLFHTNPEGAKSTIYGGLIASGWHTASLNDARVCTVLLAQSLHQAFK
ncbi:MAG TPA: MaoC/PaaZ C-terminal domain-containing protein [Methylomicrobium sp.]|nr:MaoC/PaaZ C-terminal domain-containing protein [Methylomicrobium sp.]